jgi:hypothetical protein
MSDIFLASAQYVNDFEALCNGLCTMLDIVFWGKQQAAEMICTTTPFEAAAIEKQERHTTAENTKVGNSGRVRIIRRRQAG